MPNPPSTRIAQLPRGVVAHLRSDAVDRQIYLSGKTVEAVQWLSDVFPDDEQWVRDPDGSGPYVRTGIRIGEALDLGALG